jgi:hypothetical protein
MTSQLFSRKFCLLILIFSAFAFFGNSMFFRQGPQHDFHLYKIFNLDPQASSEQIKAEYDKIIRKNAPSRNPGFISSKFNLL